VLDIPETRSETKTVDEKASKTDMETITMLIRAALISLLFNSDNFIFMPAVRYASRSF
jgi:hypothetical protein